MASSTSPSDSLPVVHADSGNSDGSAASRVVKTVKSAVRVPESEIKRWRRTFDANAKALVDGEKCVSFFFLVRNFRLNAAFFVSRFLDREQFVNAIAPKGDLTRIGRAQFAILFRVADVAKRGLMSWDDFVVFQTLLKRPDADYYIAFQYFDVYARTCPVLHT
jgi:solute carrier family 25 (mitochondrial aspartate/glutamate transporter), member 12/13